MGLGTLRRHHAAAIAAASGSQPKTREQLLEDSLRVEREKNAALQVQLAEIQQGKALAPELEAKIQGEFDRIKNAAEERLVDLEKRTEEALTSASDENAALRGELDKANADLAAAKAELDAERAKNAPAPPTPEPPTEPEPKKPRGAK